MVAWHVYLAGHQGTPMTSPPKFSPSFIGIYYPVNISEDWLSRGLTTSAYVAESIRFSTTVE